MGLRQGEVEFLTVALPSGSVKRALGPYTHDLIVQVQSNETVGVYLAVKRTAALRGDNRAQVYMWHPRRFPLGKGQILWIHNSNKSDGEVNLEYWLAGGPV